MSVVLRNVQRVVPVRRAALRRAVCALLAAGELPRPRCRDEYNLGDIFLGVEYIHQQCRETGEDFDDVLTVTAAHGLCHLLGYRHDTKPEWEQMYQKEAQILQELNRLAGSRLRPLTAGLF
ncbi:endoribonuclease YbeY isoform X5 [Cinclus cinclus]|uniref:endoribonuclease YbeY isoform X5 n=1 Tax=Cinclus cinclus TaxID=127875 RepID=UPI002E0E940C